jgi:hypothetical protein
VNFDAMFVLKLSQRFPCQGLGHLFHQFVPRNSFFAVIDANHGDTFFNRADDEAQSAAHTIRFSNFWLILSVMRNEIDTLVGSIVASDVTEITLNTF